MPKESLPRGWKTTTPLRVSLPERYASLFGSLTAPERAAITLLGIQAAERDPDALTALLRAIRAGREIGAKDFSAPHSAT